MSNELKELKELKERLLASAQRVRAQVNALPPDQKSALEEQVREVRERARRTRDPRNYETSY